MEPIQYSVSYGPLTRTVYTLTDSLLDVRTEGGVAGPTLQIPIRALRHFCVVRQPSPSGHTPRGAVVRAAQAYAGNVQLAMAWDESGRKRSKRFLVHGDDPAFLRLVDTLVALRPDASLLQMDEQAALRKMGLLTKRQQLAIAIVAIIALAIVYGAVKAMLR